MRLVMVRIEDSRSNLITGMSGSLLPVVVAHGEGRAEFPQEQAYKKLRNSGRVCMSYLDNHDKPTMQYPLNPNGSDFSVAAVTNDDGRITAMMPHPERVFRNVQYSWTPEPDQEASHWMALFRNARAWVN